MKPFASISFGILVVLFTGWPVLISGTRQQARKPVPVVNTTPPPPAPAIAAPSPVALVEQEAYALYDSMKLRRAGLSKKAFLYAWKGYTKLIQKGVIRNDEVLSICDFSQSSRKKRMYIIDVANKKLLMNTWVAHGRNSGGEYARSFSNKPESHKSSLGFYLTRQEYYGEHGLSLKIDGIEQGINDKARARNIVIHGSPYVGAGYLKSNRVSGRSFGCPAVPAKDSHKVIQAIKGGTCLFIYHPSESYLSRSSILNG